MSVSFNIRGYVDRRTQELTDRGDAIERRRAIKLQPIAVKPIARPIYCNRGILDFAQWRIDNLQALTGYWNSLVCAEEAQILGEEDFHLFTLVQHERELDTRDEYKRCYGSKGDQL
jgi:hypothetical protein